MTGNSFSLQYTMHAQETTCQDHISPSIAATYSHRVIIAKQLSGMVPSHGFQWCPAAYEYDRDLFAHIYV